ncbi:hypothetical protein [Fictibacillus solisalsi]|uniref:hypothetical protein n=1 Tax=Fictibacillus solisalsi TaxID=459525 RepID=UPI0011145DE4|nr:hypothetical protein [Fictibacillus solisalsi]
MFKYGAIFSVIFSVIGLATPLLASVIPFFNHSKILIVSASLLLSLLFSLLDYDSDWRKVAFLFSFGVISMMGIWYLLWSVLFPPLP